MLELILRDSKVNEFLKKLNNKERIVGTFFEIGGTTAAECMGRTPFDYIIIDNEHGTFEGESTLDAIRGANMGGITPFVRVREISRSAIMKPLDVGAKGLIIPFVESIDDVNKIIKWSKYQPIGTRGFCPSRKDGWGYDSSVGQSMDEVMEYWNKETLVIPQCETLGCLENIEEIVSMEGVDGIFIGPYDLSIGLGMSGQFENPDFLAAVERIKTACHNAGKFIIIFTMSTEAAQKYFRQGFDSVTIGLDIHYYIDSCSKVAEEAKK